VEITEHQIRVTGTRRAIIENNRFSDELPEFHGLPLLKQRVAVWQGGDEGFLADDLACDADVVEMKPAKSHINAAFLQCRDLLGRGHLGE